MTTPTTTGDTQAALSPGYLQKVWKGWLSVAHLIGTVQMVIVLTIVYWLFIPLVYIPFGLIADPLRLRKSSGSQWLEREQPDEILENMRRQG